MEPDLITGSGSTGLFMNRYGITEIMSLEDDTDFLEQTIDQSAYGSSSPNAYGQPYTGPDASPVALAKLRGMFPQHRFRVAAQDAFMELLSLFKNNGITRFVSSDSDSPFNNRTQLSPTIWSAQYGSNTSQRNARNNDVMVKGQVIMNFKGNVYQGYFKSLTWTIGDESPLPGGLENGDGNLFPETPCTKCGTAFARKIPAKKLAMYRYHDMCI